MLIPLSARAARGRGGGHKGGRKQYTNPEELNARTEREEREKAWRRNRGELESESGDEDGSGQEGSGEESEEEEVKETRGPKGAEALIEVQNPNRVVKAPRKAAAGEGGEGSSGTGAGGEVQLSRREREELEKQRARENYLRLHAEGKTEQARADLARLALIRREREEAAKKREQERQEREGASKTAAVNKVAGVRSAVTAVTAPAAAAAPGLRKKAAAKK